jgi:hypothetical protein
MEVDTVSTRRCVVKPKQRRKYRNGKNGYDDWNTGGKRLAAKRELRRIAEFERKSKEAGKDIIVGDAS